MRRYDDPVEVRRGPVGAGEQQVEGPAQFLWHGRLWKVFAVVAHWVETGPWWQAAEARAALGLEQEGAVPGSVSGGAATVVTEPAAEREVWRVEAGRGVQVGGQGRGVFDLSFDWSSGDWRLTRCLD